MNKHITILRGINVGGHRKILMADLKTLFQKLGAKNVETYIQSGNVIFEHKNADNLSSIITDEIERTFGFKVPTITFSEKYLQEIIINNSFADEFEVERLHITFFKHEPEAALVKKLTEFDFGKDDFIIKGRAVYVYCHKKYSDTKLNNQFFEKKLNTPATTRNWKTILKINELVTKVT